MSKNSSSAQNISDNADDAKTKIIVAIIGALAIIIAAIIGANWFGNLMKAIPTPTNSVLLIQIKVTDRETAQPIPNALVQLGPPGEPDIVKTTTTDGVALFSLDHKYSDQIAEVTVSASGYHLFAGNVKLEKNIIDFPIPIQLEK